MQSFHRVGARPAGARVHPVTTSGRLPGATALRDGALDRRLGEHDTRKHGSQRPEQPLSLLTAGQGDAMKSMTALAGRAGGKATRVHARGGTYGSPSGAGTAPNDGK